jgi:hypothetical protein
MNRRMTDPDVFLITKHQICAGALASIMSNQSEVTNIAKIAGLLYLLVIMFGMFSEVYVSQMIIVPGDPAATSQNIVASETLFRVGFVADLIHHTCFFLVSIALYLLLKPVNKNQALVMMLFGVASVPIMMLNMLNQYIPLLLMSGADYLAVFSTAQLQALVALFLDFHSYGYYIAGIFTGLYMLPLGQLVQDSGFIPEKIGLLVKIGGIGYLINVFTIFLLPRYEVVSYIGLAVSVIAELSLIYGLLAGNEKP